MTKQPCFATKQTSAVTKQVCFAAPQTGGKARKGAFRALQTRSPALPASGVVAQGSGPPRHSFDSCFFTCHCSSKNPASTTLPGFTASGAVLRSSMAQSGSFGTWRALLR